MSLVKYAEKQHKNDIPAMQSTFSQLWRHTRTHYRTGPCRSGCPCTLGIDDATQIDYNASGFFSDIKLPGTTPASSPSAKMMNGRMYLDPNLKTHMRYLEAVDEVVTFIEDHLENFIHGYNTCFAESMHAKRLKYTNKRKAYMKFEVTYRDDRHPRTYHIDAYQ